LLSDKYYKHEKKNLKITRLEKMDLNLSEIGFQNAPLEHKSTSASVSAYFSSELSLKTDEGDIVNLSFAGEQSLSESSSQTLTEENGAVQEFSTVARAAASYSLSVEGDLNEDELAAINKLANEISPLVKDFFSSGELNLEDSTNVLANNLGAIQEVELSLERKIVATFETRSISRLPEEAGYAGDVNATPNQTTELETGDIRDFPALVQSTINAVFESEANQAPESEAILRSLNDLLDFIRNRFGEFFNPVDGPDAIPVESAPAEPATANEGDANVQPSSPTSVEEIV
jgi:hypothetical protein